MSSKTESTTNSSGPGFQDVNDSSSVSVSGINTYKSIGTTFNFQTSDMGAIEAGIGAANNAIDAIEGESEKNRVFAGEVAGGAVKGITSVVDKAFTLVGEMTSGLTKAITGENDANRLFLGESTTAFLDNNLETTNAAFQYAGETAAGSIKAVSDANHNASVLADNALTFSIDAIDKFSSFANDSVARISSNSTENLEVVAAASRSDASNSLNKVVTVAGVVFAVIGIAIAVIAKK